MKTLLFLCTGNYYRSRFCECYFNHHAQSGGLCWRAESRGLAPDITVFRNPGPLSPYTRAALATLQISLNGEPRYPLSVSQADLLAADRVIALSRQEHEPMVQAYFAADGPRIEYWEIGDIPLELPEKAIASMMDFTDQLLLELRKSNDRL